MLEYPRWKYLLIAIVLLLALAFALPNFFGEDPAVQVIRKDRAALDVATEKSIEDALRAKSVPFIRSYLDGGRLMVRFAGVPAQLRARDVLAEGFGDQYLTALSFAPRAPDLLLKLGLRPMPLGLDLRGGLYLLYQVDVNGAVSQLLDAYEQDFRRELDAAKIALVDVTTLHDSGGALNGVRIVLPAGVESSAVIDLLHKTHSDLAFSAADLATGGRAVDAVITPKQIRERQDYAIEKNIITLRNRVNELGVSEPIVQRQGLDRINVQLPGVQNSADVKDILGKVATLEFRLEDMDHNAFEAQTRGRAPLGSKLYTGPGGQPVLLKREVIVTGDQLTNASTTATQEGPGVSVTLNSAGGEQMLKTTRANIDRRMAVVFIEKSRRTETVDGQKVEREVTDQRVISLATIRGIFSNNFQITGLSQREATELSLLLRAGSLAAPIYPIEERAIGPSLGQENIDKGVLALIVGMSAVFVFMVVYYRVFGLVADLVLLANVLLLTALLSLMRASLSLPGIAGIILTVGIAVDANVLIYERIREELRNRVTPQAAIVRGFDKALSAIADSNITALIAGVVLWVFGSGPVRGFAVVLTLGIATSMFTALMGSRALVTLLYGGRRKLTRLSI
jgi:preprotein translocase subunit SecD